jgi:hypothetical protein
MLTMHIAQMQCLIDKKQVRLLAYSVSMNIVFFFYFLHVSILLQSMRSATTQRKEDVCAPVYIPSDQEYRRVIRLLLLKSLI